MMVSVCIPVYNGARYIGETLESLSCQTYRDFEVVVSDNASTDGTADVVAQWKDRLPRLRYSRNDKNLGYCANVAKAVSLAASEIVAIYHSDDIYNPIILEQEIRILEKRPEIAGVFTRTSYYRREATKDKENSLPDGLRRLVRFDSEMGVYLGELDGYGEALLRYGNFFVCPSFMTRKRIFQESGGFTDDYPTSEDLHLWIRLLEEGHSLAIIDKPLVRYRISEFQGSAILRKNIGLSQRFSVMDAFLVDRPFVSETVRIAYREQKAKDLLAVAVNAFRQKKRKLAMDRVAESRSIYSFHGFSRYALTQRFPLLGLPVGSILMVIREKGIFSATGV